jgi:molybdopterin molybdotransferase
MSLSLHQARSRLIDEVSRLRAAGAGPTLEPVDLSRSLGRVLAEGVYADRDQPPFHRSTRDGFAVRSADVARAGAGTEVVLAVLGEVAAGAAFAGAVGTGSAVEIMTGAPLPEGADAVVMIEHIERRGSSVVLRRPVEAGENVVRRGSELAAGALAQAAGRLIDPGSLGLLASLGCARPTVFARPRVAVVSTGDELVGVAETPTATQIRDSNRHALAAQIGRAGGEVVAFPTVRDDLSAVSSRLREAASAADMLLVSGGVSMGKYDHVERALSDLHAEIVFDGVDIRPGRPVVFGSLPGKPISRPFSVPFLGLPGNPLSALVTFELFARPAIELLGGRATVPPLGLTCARLATDYAQRKLPLTVFAPARLEPPVPADGIGPALVRPIASQGSGDLASLAAADVFLVIEPGMTAIAAGALVPILPK